MSSRCLISVPPDIEMRDSNQIITERIQEFLKEIPAGVTVLAAAKQRTIPEIQSAIEAGITNIGHNYVQEGQEMAAALGNQAKWHMIGHLQKNKARAALEIFDMLQTVDSIKLARIIQRLCDEKSIVYPVLIEINSAEEPQKNGLLPGEVDKFLDQMQELDNISVQGLLTMGPFVADPEEIRPFFRKTRQIFDRLASRTYPNIKMKYLSMGMSSSYQVAIQEGANMIRIGTALFGERAKNDQP